MSLATNSLQFRMLLEQNHNGIDFLTKFLPEQGFSCVLKYLQGNSGNISLTFRTENNRMATACVRVDYKMNRTKNFIFETLHYRKHPVTGQTVQEEGWYYTCAADYVFMIDVKGNKVYMLDWKKARRYLTLNPAASAEKAWNNTYDKGTVTRALFLTVAAAKEAGLIENEWTF